MLSNFVWTRVRAFVEGLYLENVVPLLLASAENVWKFLVYLSSNKRWRSKTRP